MGVGDVGITNQAFSGTSINFGNRSVNLAANGYQPAYSGHSAYHGYWNGHYGGTPWGYGHGYGYGYGYGPGYGYGYPYYRPLGWGLGAWGLGLLAYNSGYLGYSNPYYVVSSGYDYGQPIPVSTTIPDAAPADDVLNSAVSAFKLNDFDTALRLVDQGITQTPSDAVLHEFRALILFAKGDYQPAAATIHSVLAVGPGWNWTTLSGLYADVSSYTTQLRALEASVRSHPQDGAGRFLLAYHYLIAGHNEAAARQLQQVVALTPTDRIAVDLLRMVSPSKTERPTTPPPQPTGEAASAAASFDPASLVGSWIATRDDGSQFTLSLTSDEKFTWKYAPKDQKPQELSGTYTMDGHALALENAGGGALVATVTPGAGKRFNFKLLGAPEDDPGLEFRR